MCLYGFAFELSYSLFVGRGSVYAWLALHPCKALRHTCVRHPCLFMNALLALRPCKAFGRSFQASSILRKSVTLLKVGTIHLHFRPPSMQLKPISIFLKGEFEAAHSRKVGTVSGDPPQNLHSTIAKPRPFHYPAKIRNVIKGRNSQRRLAA